MRDRQIAFRAAQEIVGVLGGVGDHQRLRIGQPDVLDRHAHHAARDVERRLAGIQHAAKIIQRGVGIGAAYRLVQCADQIVVAVLRLVVDRRAPLHDLLQLGGVKNFAFAGGTPDFLGKRQRGAAVAVGHADERGACVVVERQLAALDLLGARKQFLDRFRIEGFEHQHTRAREQRRVELERRVFGGGADQHDGAVLHHRQE